VHGAGGLVDVIGQAISVAEVLLHVLVDDNERCSVKL
jgi:hypothetical protein